MRSLNKSVPLDSPLTPCGLAGAAKIPSVYDLPGLADRLLSLAVGINFVNQKGGGPQPVGIQDDDSSAFPCGESHSLIL